MWEALRFVPWYVIVGVVVALIGITAFVVIRALGEGREVSFWPPRIGARAQAMAGITVQRPDVLKDREDGTVPSVALKEDPIALLYVISGGEIGGRAFIILAGSRRITIGSSDHADIVLRSLTVSSSHCAILVRSAASPGTVSYEFMILDVISSNGTFVDGAMLRASTAVPLPDQSIVQVGGVRLQFFSLRRHSYPAGSVPDVNA